MIRVAHLTFSGAFGGREKVAFSLVRALNPAMYAILYLVIESRAERAKQQELMQHLSEYAMPIRTLNTDAFFACATLKDLASSVKEDGISIIHAHCHKSLAYALMLRYLYCPNLRVTCTLHGLKIPLDRKFLVHHLLNTIGMLGADAIIGCSREIVAGIGRVPLLNGKISVIRNNLPLMEKQLADRDILRTAFRLRHNIPDHKTCWIGNASRLTAQKNIPMYLDAIGKFAALSDRKDIIFLLAGDGELKDELLARAARLGLGDVFRFVGFLTSMDEFYRMLDLFVLTSDWEGTPMAALEAMSHGLPIIATSVGGVPDVVVSGSTGILIPKGDLQACVDALVRLLGDDDTRKQMGYAARDRIVTEFTEERWVREHLAHYRHLSGLKEPAQA